MGSVEYPYHIIKAECPECINGIVTSKGALKEQPFDCPTCYGIGTRLMAKWLPEFQPEKTIFDSMTHEQFIKTLLTYQSNTTLPRGEKIGEVLLKYGCDSCIGTSLEGSDFRSCCNNEIASWFCCAHLEKNK